MLRAVTNGDIAAGNWKLCDIDAAAVGGEDDDNAAAVLLLLMVVVIVAAVVTITVVGVGDNTIDSLRYARYDTDS